MLDLDLDRGFEASLLTQKNDKSAKRKEKKLLAKAHAACSVGETPFYWKPQFKVRVSGMTKAGKVRRVGQISARTLPAAKMLATKWAKKLGIRPKSCEIQVCEPKTDLILAIKVAKTWFNCDIPPNWTYSRAAEKRRMV